jgi:hypothetical protein
MPLIKPRHKTQYGELAQLGERLNGIQEVRGSIPLFSTRQDKHTEMVCLSFYTCRAQPSTHCPSPSKGTGRQMTTKQIYNNLESWPQD